ncbi:MAG: molybdenum cofactor guanylyltransferase [Promethearchaeota archaeon]
MSVESEKIAFTVLIGGKSTRFGSDKGLFEFGGKPLLSHQLNILYKFDKDIFLVAHSEEQVNEYKKRIRFRENDIFLIDNLDIVEDKEIRTPMIGLYTAFKELDTKGFDKTFVFSCDTPLIKYEVVDLILRQASGYDCYIPRWENFYLEPLLAIYPVKKAFKMAEKSIKNNIYKLIDLLSEDWRIYYISVEDKIKPLDEKLHSFININGPIDLEKLMKNFKKE